jgi:LysM repeat protein
MALKKLEIENLDNGEIFEVLFNPTEYSIEDSSKWEDQKGNRRRPELQYTGGERKKLSMELFFDTYEKKEDVRQYTSKFARLLIVSINDQNTGKRPPKVRLKWGPDNPDSGFPFTCVLESLKQQFVLFTPEGMPVRAKLSVVFKEFVLPIDEMQQEPPANSFPMQTYTVKAGDTLSGIAAALLKDPFEWRVLAEANDIDNPRLLKPAQVLVVPRIAD